MNYENQSWSKEKELLEACFCLWNLWRQNKFYGLYPDAFELDSNPGKGLDKAMSYFPQEWAIEPYEYQAKHGDFPAEFKIYAFEKLILRGTAYEQINSPYG